MPILLPRPRGVVKPSPGVLLDRGHPLSRGLRFAPIFTEGGGFKVWDAVRQQLMAFGTSVSWVRGPHGPAMRFAGTSGQQATGSGLLLSGRPWTVSMKYRITVDNQTMFWDLGATGTDNEMHFRETYAAGWDINLYSDDRNIAFTKALNTWLHVHVTQTPDKVLTLYLNGVSQGTSTAAGMFSGTTGNWVLGARTIGGTEYFNGDIDHFMLWDRALSATEVRGHVGGPYGMFAAPVWERYSVPAAGGSTGDIAVTFTVWTVALVGAETFSGPIASTFTLWTVAATGAETFTGAAASAFTPWTVAAVGAETFSGPVATAFPIWTVAAAGLETFSGTAAAVFPTWTVSAAGLETFTGSVAASLTWTTASTGTYTPAPISGTIAATLTPWTVSATGAETFAGTAAVTLPTWTVAASGLETFTGTAAASLPTWTVAAAGSFGYAGSVAVTLPTWTVAAAGLETFTGTAAPVMGWTAAGTGALAFTGSAAAIFTPWTVVATGGGIFTGTLAAAFPTWTVSAAGEETFSGDVAASITWTVSASGSEVFTGTAAAEFPQWTVTATAEQTFTGSADVTFTPWTVAAAGPDAFDGAADSTFTPWVTDAVGTFVSTLLPPGPPVIIVVPARHGLVAPYRKDTLTALRRSRALIAPHR